jgi:hypothetical protein
MAIVFWFGTNTVFSFVFYLYQVRILAAATSRSFVMFQCLQNCAGTACSLKMAEWS